MPNSKDQLKMVQTIIANCPNLSLHDVINLITPQPSQSQGPPSSGASAFTPSPPGNQLQTAKPYPGQEKQSRKDIVDKPSFRGTNAQEMHLTVPQDGPFAPLLGTSGTALKNGLETQLSGIISQAQVALFEVNLLVAARWSTKDNLILHFHGPVSPDMKTTILGAMRAKVRMSRSVEMDTNTTKGIPPPSPSDDVRLLNKPPTTLLKFLSVATINPDGSEVSDEQLLKELKVHPTWNTVTLWSPPKFLIRKGQDRAPAHIMVVSVEDDEQGSVGHALMKTTVFFSSCGGRTCLRWVPKNNVAMCSVCQMWGHHATRCQTNWLVCTKCGGPHTVKSHPVLCATCKQGKGDECCPSCSNCGGAHSTTAVDCPFWAQCFNYNGIQALVRKQRDELIASRLARVTAPKPPKKSALVIKGPLLSRPSAPMGFKKPTPPNGLRGPVPPPPPSLVQTKISFAQVAKFPNTNPVAPAVPDLSESTCAAPDRCFEELMAEAKREMAQDMEGFMEGGRPLPEGVAGSMHADHRPTRGPDDLSLSYI